MLGDQMEKLAECNGPRNTEKISRGLQLGDIHTHLFCIDYLNAPATYRTSKFSRRLDRTYLLLY